MLNVLCQILLVTLPIALDAHECPQCSDPYERNSCTLSQQCAHNFDSCELLVNTSDSYRLEYVCQNAQTCFNDDLFGCYPEINETCAYCCLDVTSCKIQRDDLFTYVFPVDLPSTTTSPATTNPGPPVPVQCPVCTNPYDPSTCSQTQTCALNTNFCELIVDNRNLYRLDYLCQDALECFNREIFGCDIHVNDTCSYCCQDPLSCKLQRDDLFTYVFPTVIPPNTPPAATASSSTSSITNTTWTTQVSTSGVPATKGRTCMKCGDYALGIPCTATELIAASYVTCSSIMPYCFTGFSHDGANVKGYKGCEEANFCRLEWDLSTSKPECQAPNISGSQQLSCMYCCTEDHCNSQLRPDDSSMLTFS